MEHKPNKNNRIFNSMFYLTFKDHKLEYTYQLKTEFSSPNILSNCLKFILLFLVCVLYFLTITISQQDDYHIVGILFKIILFILFNSILSILDFLGNSQFISKDKKIFLISKNFLVFCFSNIQMCLLSSLFTFFNLSNEITSFLLILQIGMEFGLCYSIYQRYAKISKFIFINIFSHYAMLMYLKNISINFLIFEISIKFIIILILYLFEYRAKVFFYFYNKLNKERDYYMETFKIFNISSFKSKNYEIKNQINIDEMLNNYKMDDTSNKYPLLSENISILNIEKLFANLIADTKTQDPLEKYILDYIKDNSFKFEKLVEHIFFKNQHFNNEQFEYNFNNFKKIGILKLKNNLKEDTYFQVFLKIKIGSNESQSVINSSSSLSSTLNIIENVKIEGVFKDITHFFLKKQTQTNSLVLSKLIHDLKSPLFLLKQVIEKYKDQNVDLYDKLKPILSDERNSPEIKPNSIHNSPTKTEIHSQVINIKNNTKNLKTISDNVFQIIRHINNFAKKQNSLESNIQNNFKFINLKKLIDSCLKFYNITVKFNKKEVKLVTEIDEDVSEYIYTSKDALKQILMNLLSNAMKFTNKGKIVVKACNILLEKNEEKHKIEISVIDTGCGIDEENLSKLCKPFGITTDSKFGSGLGLCIVHDLLTSMNSKLEIKSKISEGTTFSFRLIIDSSNNNIIQEVNSDDDSSSDSSIDDTFSNFKIDKKNESDSLYEVNTSNKKFSLNSLSSKSKPSSFSFKIEEFGSPIESIKLNTKTNNDNDDRKISKISSISINSKDSEGDDEATVLFEGPLNKNNFFNNEFYHRLRKSRIDSGKYNSSSENSMIFNEKTPNFIRVKIDKSNTLKVKLTNNANSITKRINCHNSAKNVLGNIKSESKVDDINNRILDFSHSSTVPTSNIFSNVSKFATKNQNKCSEFSAEYKSKKYNILIIDDDPFYLQQLGELVASASNDLGIIPNIDAAENAIEGINYIYNKMKNYNVIYDLLLIDENMPYMKGSVFFYIYNTYLINNGFYRIPTVSISGEILTNILSPENTYDYFLDKPCGKRDIKRILEKINF